MVLGATQGLGYAGGIVTEGGISTRQESAESDSVVRSARFRRVLAANTTTMVGSAAAPVALAFAALGTGGGVTALGVVLALNAVPSILFVLYGGVLADRVSRSALLVYGRAAAGTIQMVVATLVLSEHATTWSLGALAFLSGSVSALIRPAYNAIFKQLVAASQLQQANALNRLSSNIVRVTAPAAAGGTVALTSAGWVLVFDALTFYLSAALMHRVTLRATPRTGTTSPWEDLREGWREVSARSWLVANMAFGAVIVMLWRVGFELAGPALAATGYSGASSWGLMESAFAVGLVLGGFVCLRWKPRRLAVVSTATSGTLALPVLALALHLPLAMVLSAAVITGVGLDIAIVTWSTALGQHIPDAVQGRVQSVNSIGELSVVPVGYAVVAAVGPHLSMYLIAGIAAVGIVTATACNLMIRSLWTINRLA
ncbi:MFS transporter [Nocardia wallacei]|uniref:MFS transporter n=1 Tax=Nocardia wallacei TaxID=480035 RepID=UPI002456FAB8|nr:MFS transporter [Nocardia wallacei]